MSIRNKEIIVYDRGGLYTYRAQDLGRDYGKVRYYIPDSSAYPESPKAAIGKGLPEIERIDDVQFYKHLRKADMIYFPDAYDGAYQAYLRSEGHTVFGSGPCDKIETDKVFFLSTLDNVGLAVPKTYLAEGIDDLLAHLEGKGEKWLKGLYRGDFETRKFDNMRQFKNWLTHELLPRIGPRAKNIKILVQNTIKSECEAGYDGMMIDGACIDDCLIGYEVKDECYVAKCFDYVPEIIKGVNDKMQPVFKKIGGYFGDYSTELRITASGKPYYIDATCRTGSPPGELFSSMCENYSEAAWMVANGEAPKLEWRAKYGAEIVLTSPWYADHPLVVEFAKEHYDNVKLKQHHCDGGIHTCVPNGNGEFFGAVIAYDDDKETAMQKCMDIAKEINCEGFSYKGGSDTFKKAQDAIDAGEKFDIPFD